jgi:pyroglutamyl-peptidase
MPTILLTAYGPYDNWRTNTSQLVLEQLAAALHSPHAVTPRVYPVDFRSIHELIRADLAADFDFAIHMGQAPGYAAVTLEALGINVAVERGQSPDTGSPLVPGGAEAYRAQPPLADWAESLRNRGIPAAVSHHAGTYLCNAALYLSRYETERRRLKTQSAFLHLPMATELVATMDSKLPSLPLETLTAAVQIILERL